MQLIEAQDRAASCGKPTAEFAGNGLPDEWPNPLCHKNEITGQGQPKRSEIETEIWH